MLGRPAAYDLTGQRFGRLLVIERSGSTSNGGRKWRCVCECGAPRVIAGDSLIRGATASCGCAQRELLGARSLKHGSCRSPEYGAWKHIKERCFVETCASFKDYGARGITMCPAWRDNFEAFLADVGKRPTAQHSIDRIDNEGNYEPGNCRWALPVEQLNNQRRNVRVRLFGEMLSVSDACRRTNISRVAVYSRIHRGTAPQIAFERLAAKGGIRV